MARNPKYIHVPEEILMDRSLSPNEKFVLSNIHSVCTGANNNTYRFGNGWIANYLGITRRSASTIVNSLIKMLQMSIRYLHRNIYLYFVLVAFLTLSLILYLLFELNR